MAAGGGTRGDVDTLIRLAGNIKGRTLCPLGDAAAMPVTAIAQKFRTELEATLERSPVRP
jgi:NADH-quinone oxidoreductase subunit F